VTTLEHMRRAARVKVMIFDVDGILTDGSLTYGPDGEVTKTFNVLDGLGIQLLQKTGVATAIISARKSPIVVRRAADLGITHVWQGIHDKRVAFAELLAQTGFTAEQCGYIGDDVIDLPLLTAGGLCRDGADRPPGSAAPRPLRHQSRRRARRRARSVRPGDARPGHVRQALAPYFA
jgi:3-deoxy-D-manno-octulosonate 8-phosphate phosphatase (KDO 8-P phosphatase)